MGETAIVQGVFKYPNEDTLDDIVAQLQHAGWLNRSEQWVDLFDLSNAVPGDYDAVDRDANILRIPEGAYRNLHRGLQLMASEASDGGAIGTKRCCRIGLVATAANGLQATDLRNWGLDHVQSELPHIEDDGYTSEREDQWFRETAAKFLAERETELQASLGTDADPIETAQIPA